MLRIHMGYPQPLEEIVILDEQKRTHPIEELEVVASVDELRSCRRRCARSTSTRSVSDYIVRLVNATRNHPDVYLGASPRGSLALYRAGQATPRSPAATTSSPTTSRHSRCRPSRTG